MINGLVGFTSLPSKTNNGCSTCLIFKLNAETYILYYIEPTWLRLYYTLSDCWDYCSTAVHYCLKYTFRNI